jgi:rRNA-processing protein FCF1
VDPLQFITIIVLLAVLAGVSYLVINAPRQFSVRRQLRPILLDTSVLIDGRIVGVARTGFISGTLIIPRSVLGELQFLADTGDHDKRSRARFGLDVVSELQGLPKTDVQILQDGSKADEGVDERLLTLAKKHGAAICTIDYNLNKVALVEGISVLNLNELAQGLRMAYLPGERMHLDLVQKGQDSHQAVGYLPDGTMVVVEHANKLIGQTAEVEIIRSLQTAAGRMMFAKRLDGGQPKNTKADAAPAATTGRSGKRPEVTPVNKEQPADRPQGQSRPAPRRPDNRNVPKQRNQGRSRRGQADVESDLINLIEKL